MKRLHWIWLLSLVFANPDGWGADALQARQWCVSALTYTANRDVADPFDFERADFSAIFHGPAGAEWKVPGFWDGGRTWRIRFTPTAPGRWHYETRFSDAGEKGLHGQVGTIDVQPPLTDTPLHQHGGLLQVSSNHRYLTYSDGTPFFWLGDTWWAAPSANVPLDVFKQQVDVRLAQGYTVFQMHGHRPLTDSETIGAFEATRHADAATLRYWQQVDRYLAYAEARGMVGCIGFARGDMFDPISLTDLQRLWRYYLARYGAYPVLFLITQEYNIEPDKRQQYLPKMLALGQFIKDTDPYRRALTAHPWARSRDLGQAWNEPWLDFIMFQAGHRRFEKPSAYHEVWQQPSPKPFIEGEANYEGFAATNFNVNAAAIRRSAYTALQSGSFGFTYGAQGLYAGVFDHAKPGPTFRWGPVLTWKEGLALPGGAQLQHLRVCYESVDWWKLEPRPKALEPSADVLVKADGAATLLLYYVSKVKLPPGCHLKDLPDGQAYAATWFDPRTGGTTKLPDGCVVKTEKLPLPAPPDTQDWMLILRKLGSK
jgi:hypothetical protein